MNKSLENRLKLIAGDSNVRCDEPMSSHCTFRAGGTAKYYVIPDEYKKVRDVLRLCVEENIPYYVIGNGSNLLVQDDGFDGVIIEIDSALAKIEINGKFERSGNDAGNADLCPAAAEKLEPEGACGTDGRPPEHHRDV